MKTRKQIAAELMKNCPADIRADHQRIADAIERGDSLDNILNMPEMDDYPDTYVWVQSELEN